MKYDLDAAKAALALRAWRRMAGITQAELAAICGVCRATVVRWEDPGCDYSPGTTHLRRIQRATRADLLYLVQKLEGDEIWAK